MAQDINAGSAGNGRERKLKLGILSAGKIIEDMMEMSLLYTEEDIPFPLWLSTLNEVSAKMKAILAGKDSVEYTESVAIPILKSVNAALIAGSSFDGDTGELVLPVDDVTWVNGEGFDESWTGIEGTITVNNTATDYKVRITGVLAENTVILESTDNTTIPDIAEDDLIVNLSTYGQRNNDDVDLSLWDKYKRIDSIKKITYSRGTGANKRVKDCIGPPKVTDKNFDSMRYSRNYADNVLWIREGEVLKFSRGTNVANYGEDGRVLLAVLNPAICESETDIVDIRYEDLDNLKKAVLIRIITGLPKDKVKIALPGEWMRWYSDMFEQKKAKKEEKIETENK